MKRLPMKSGLNEKTKLKTVVLYKPDGIYDMHCGLGDDNTVYITEHGNPNNVLLWCAKGLWNKIFGKLKYLEDNLI